MIRYALVCGDGHEFESWFRSSSAFDTLKDAGQVTCAVCGGTSVEKAIMAPNVARRDRDEPRRPQPAPEKQPVAANGPAPLAKELQALQAKLAAYRAHVEETCENVGERFPEEARAIHYGETEARGIFGQASRDDVKELVDEGIEILPLPTAPSGKN